MFTINLNAKWASWALGLDGLTEVKSNLSLSVMWLSLTLCLSDFTHKCECFTCHNPNLGFAIKARACKGVGQKGSSRVTSHAPRSVRECEGMNLHTPKWVPILGVRISMDFQIFKKQLQRSKPIWLRSSFYHWKYFGT
jgi:hypothetical protein